MSVYPDSASETERVRRLMDKGAPRYDRQMNFFDRVLFAGGANGRARRRMGRCWRSPSAAVATLPSTPRAQR